MRLIDVAELTVDERRTVCASSSPLTRHRPMAGSMRLLVNEL